MPTASVAREAGAAGLEAATALERLVWLELRLAGAGLPPPLPIAERGGAPERRALQKRVCMVRAPDLARTFPQ